MADTGEPLPLLRKLMPFTGVAILIAALYVGYTFYSRASQAREYERSRADKEAADARRTVDLLGGGKFKILNFYAAQPAIKRGSTATLCYGTSEAKNVKINPPVEELHPAISHCLQVTPKKTTDYALTADDGAGHTDTKTLTVSVIP